VHDGHAVAGQAASDLARERLIVLDHQDAHGYRPRVTEWWQSMTKLPSTVERAPASRLAAA
jgi:hypothetical protein